MKVVKEVDDRFKQMGQRVLEYRGVLRFCQKFSENTLLFMYQFSDFFYELRVEISYLPL